MSVQVFFVYVSQSSIIIKKTPLFIAIFGAISILAVNRNIVQKIVFTDFHGA
jgi:hypothetical protein